MYRMKFQTTKFDQNVFKDLLRFVEIMYNVIHGDPTSLQANVLQAHTSSTL